MYQRAIVLTVFLCLLFRAGDAPAPGGAAFCGVASYNRIASAAIVGTPDQLVAEIQREIDCQEQELSFLTKIKFYFHAESRNVWRKTVGQTLLRGDVKCREGTYLLEHAVAGGNTPVVRYLLDAGVDPNAKSSGGETLFMRCIDIDEVWEAHARDLGRKAVTNLDIPMERRIEAMSLVLERGGELNTLNRHGDNALQTCRNPAIKAFYARRGVDVLPHTWPRP
jgi:hypothetical protein